MTRQEPIQMRPVFCLISIDITQLEFVRTLPTPTPTFCEFRVLTTFCEFLVLTTFCEITVDSFICLGIVSQLAYSFFFLLRSAFLLLLLLLLTSVVFAGWHVYLGFHLYGTSCSGSNVWRSRQFLIPPVLYFYNLY